jgi:ABC-type Fe3+/spermidine/putrescine transport system ATPase subunit
MTRSLEFHTVSHRHPGAAQDTVTDLDVRVEPSAMLAVLGPSGSGKSSMLRLAAGLLSPTAGTVSVDGSPVDQLPPERRDITLMFQKAHLFPHLSVLDNVAFPGVVSGLGRSVSREAARRYLDLVHLADLAARMPRQLSGGQEQRVALARALATRRSVMLLDEPFSALDVELRRAMHALLQEIRAAVEPAVVLVTHDVNEAALADRVAVLIDGRVAQLSPVTELYSAPATLSVARMIGGFNEVFGHVDGAVHRSALGAIPVSTPCPSGARVLLLRHEHLELCPPGSPGSLGEGLVTSLGHAGPRQLAEVALPSPASPAGQRLVVELPVGSTSGFGERVAVRLLAGSLPSTVPSAAATDLAGGSRPVRSRRVVAVGLQVPPPGQEAERGLVDRLEPASRVVEGPADQ